MFAQIRNVFSVVGLDRGPVVKSTVGMSYKRLETWCTGLIEIATRSDDRRRGGLSRRDPVWLED